MSGPLAGLRIMEVGGIGPGPFAGMMLADLGAEVIRVDRPGGIDQAAHRVLLRGRTSVVLDLKQESARDAVLRLADSADAIIEGFRPGVMERLGLGPKVLLARNPRLVYGRMTGWGQDGPMADRAGHDINYISLAGALEPLAGPDGAPVPPHNLLGDFGGGGMLLVVGVVSALLNAQRTGAGQVVDAAIVDGAALMTVMLQSLRAAGAWDAPRGQNLFDGGPPYYGVYETADGKWISVGPLEPQFYAQMVEGLGLAEEFAAIPQHDVAQWPAMKVRIAERVRERTRDEWAAIFDGTDACVSPVLAPEEVLADAHIAARGTYANVDGALHPQPAPRFSVTATHLPPETVLGAGTSSVLAGLGYTHGEIAQLTGDNA